MALGGLHLLNSFYCYFQLQVLHFDKIAGLGGTVQTKVQKSKVHLFLFHIFLLRIDYSDCASSDCASGTLNTSPDLCNALNLRGVS